MNKEGPIVIIDDDLDDQFLITETLKTLDYKNEVLFFSDAEVALKFLNNTDKNPFFILSDINMPKLGGFELRKKIQTDASLNVKCTPYLFFTNSANQRSLIEAYSQSVQGFFYKPIDFCELRKTLKTILEYWSMCTVPGLF